MSDNLAPAVLLKRALAAERERDAMMIDLARIVALCGWDCDGNDPETPAGAGHLYLDAVQAVRELRQEADDEAQLEILRRAERDEARAALAAERAAVVAWLRARAVDARDHAMTINADYGDQSEWAGAWAVPDECADIADAIERGEHLTAKEPTP